MENNYFDIFGLSTFSIIFTRCLLEMSSKGLVLIQKNVLKHVMLSENSSLRYNQEVISAVDTDPEVHLPRGEGLGLRIFSPL